MSTNTAAMRTGTIAGGRKSSIGRKIADYFENEFAGYQAEIVCGMLMLSGHTNVYPVYRMLKG